MKQILVDMIETYKPNGIDWMGYKLSKDNPYTCHHIIEKENDGELTVDNAAILTLQAHRLLHKLSRICPEGYRDFQNLFREINSRKIPLDDDTYSEIYAMLLDIFYHNVYNVHKTKKLQHILDISMQKKAKVKQKYINRCHKYR